MKPAEKRKEFFVFLSMNSALPFLYGNTNVQARRSVRRKHANVLLRGAGDARQGQEDREKGKSPLVQRVVRRATETEKGSDHVGQTPIERAKCSSVPDRREILFSVGVHTLARDTGFTSDLRR